MCCIAEIAAFVLGILTLVKGRLAVTGSRVVEGASARVVGVLLLCPLAIGQGGGFAYGFFWAAQHAAKGGQVNFNDVQALERELQTPLLIINIAGSAVPLLIAFVVGLANSRAIQPGRGRRLEVDDDYEDDYPPDRGAGQPPRRRPPDDEYRD